MSHGTLYPVSPGKPSSPPQSNPGEIFTEGFIGMSLSPGIAQLLLNKLTKCDCRTIGIRVHYGGRYQCRSGVLDYKVDRQKGTVVTQDMWRPQQQGDVHRHFEAVELLWPIFFSRRDGVVGVDLLLAVNNSWHIIHNPEAEAPLGGLASTHFCLKWPGYPVYKRQAEIRDSQRSPIKMSKLVERIAKFVARWFEEASQVPIDQDYQQWQVGPNGITQNHICVIGLVHVSAGTWQPILQLKCLVMPS